jgi:hypothetical protein
MLMKRRKLRVMVGVLCVATLQLAAVAGADEFPTASHDTARSGFTTAPAVGFSPAESWRFNGETRPSPLGAVHAPVVAGGRVFLVTDAPPNANGDVAAGVLALDAVTGAQDWALTTGPGTNFTEDAKGPAAVSGSVVYVTFADCLVAMDAATGNVQWTFPRYEDQTEAPSSHCGLPARSAGDPKLGGFSDGPTVGTDGTVYVPTGEGFLAAITPPPPAGSPTLKWSFQTAPYLESQGCDRDLRSMAAISAAGNVYVGSDDPDGRLWRLNAATGTPINSATIGPFVSSGPCAFTTFHDQNTTPSIDQLHGRVYIGSDDGNVHAYDLAALTVIAGFPAPAGFQTDAVDNGPEDGIPAVDPTSGIVVVTSGDGNSYAIRSDGSSAWNHKECATGYPSGGFDGPSPVIASNGLVYVGTFCGLFAYDVVTGAPRWRSGADVVEFGPAVGADGTIYYPIDSLAADDHINSERSLLVALHQGPPSTIKVYGSPAFAVEGGTDGGFTFVRTGDTNTWITVNYSVGGTATAGVDYNALSGSVNLAFGESSKTVPVHAIFDGGPPHDSPEAVTVNITRGSFYVSGSPSQATVDILETAPAVATTVTVAALPTNAVEGGADGAFVFTRTGDTAQTITVGYTVGGSATSGTDYDPLGTALIPAGASSVTVPVHALADMVADDGETVTATVSPGVDYAVGSPSSATVTILETAPKHACDNAPVSSYSDRDTAGVHAKNVDCITAYGLAKGFLDNTYRPALDVSRAQMASFIARLLAKAGVSLPANPPDAFPGDNGDVHELSINQIAALGLLDATTGQTGNKYNVADPMKREDMAQLLFNAFKVITGSPLPAGPDAFTDDNTSDNQDAINALAAQGVVEGKGGGLYDPTGPVSRGQFASFFARFVQVLVDAGKMQPLP